MDVADEGDERGGDEETDAGNGHQASDSRGLSGERSELLLDHLDTAFEIADLGAQLGECGSQRVGQLALGILDVGPSCGNRVVRTQGDDDAELAQQRSQAVDACSSFGEPAGAQPVQRCKRLLRHGLDGHGADLLVAVGLEHALGVGAIGLVASHVGTHGVRGQQYRGVPEGLGAARPEVRRTAGFHDDCRGRKMRESERELLARVALLARHLPHARAG